MDRLDVDQGQLFLAAFVELELLASPSVCIN
jgi:hypothetical protein